MKTTKTYEEEIKNEYITKKTLGELRGNLNNLTPSNIRNVCLNIIDGGVSTEDKLVIQNFFKRKKENDLRSEVKSFDLDLLKPICKFLKNETDSIHSTDALELIAVVINFKPRPYRNYIKSDLESITNLDNVKYGTNETTGKGEITITPNTKSRFKWNSKLSRSVHPDALKTLIIISIVIGVFFYIIYENQPRWMIWQNDHYIEVSFDMEKYDFNQLKLYKKERIQNFKKIVPNCKTDFYKDDGMENLWYGKSSKGELEYFTSFGLHPETGKTLKKITDYMIKTHICYTFNN